MKIAYLIDYDINENSGVLQKILQQSYHWNQKGHTVYFVSFKTMCIYDYSKNIIHQLKPLKVGLGRVGTALKLLYNSFFSFRLLENIEVDILYIRYRLYMPFFNQTIKNIKVVMELNGDDRIEYKLHSKLTHYYNKFTRKYNFKYINAFVSVSHELEVLCKGLSKPSIVIANGINSQEYRLKSHKNKVPTIVFIATPNQRWQGLDKIVAMAEYFKNYQFNIIGTSDIDRDNIKYFGYLGQAESTKIIEKSDIGLGTLSLYRQGLEEASPLKTRQYLACGLPLIYAYKDTDIPNNIAFALRLENTKDNIDYQEIEDFVERVFNKKSINISARHFAEEKLDYAKKEEDRLSFFQKVLDEK